MKKYNYIYINTTNKGKLRMGNSGGKKRSTGRLTVILAVVFVLAAGSFFFAIYHLSDRSIPLYGRMTPELCDSELYEDMQSGRSFCFIGDSITYGSVTNGIGWYEPMRPYINGDIFEFAAGGWTTRSLIERRNEIPAADIYVIAIGINDVKYVEYGITEDEYISNLQTLLEHLMLVSPGAKMYFISPWVLWNHPDDIISRRTEFCEALSSWCDGAGRLYVDPYPIIMSVLEKEGADRYMYNDFHPNSPDGVGLFSYSVLQADHMRREGSA